MISILIPIYNWDTTTLINSLVKQGNSINVPYEIIAIDDFSNSDHDEMNFSMNHYDFVEVYRNEKNLGRSRTRNLLAEKAQYNWLLFIDADSFIEDKGVFLKKSVKAVENLVKLYKDGKLNKDDVTLLTQHFKRKTIVNTFGKYSKEFARKRAVNKGCMFGFDLYRLIVLTEKLAE